MKKDIEVKDDIRQLVELFYDRAKKDSLLSPFFTQYFAIDWEKHLPGMTSFWENAIFYNGSYTGNPIQTHRHLHRLFPLSKEHFDRWLSIFIQTVNDLFEGEKAELIKQRALSIATVMKIKIAEENAGISIGKPIG